MIERRKRIVLYFPAMADPASGVPVGRDLLPLSVLTVATWPAREGYEIVIVDGNLYPEAEAHARVVEACAGALLYGTTGILGYQVSDAYRCTRAVRAAHPRLPTVIGGWFASAAPELQLATGLYDAVCLGQGEITMRELVEAVQSGEPLDSVAGLALWKDGALVRTAPRSVVGWKELPRLPWHLIDIAPYRDGQLAGRRGRIVERMPVPPGFHDRPFFGISYFSSFGCPEKCTFCCSPEVSGLRWKCMPADRMLDDLADLKERWDFTTVRFYDANFGVMEKRVREFCSGLIERELPIWMYGSLQTASVVRYAEDTLDLMRDAGWYAAQMGGEAGLVETMNDLKKRTPAGANVEAADAMNRRGICPWMTYIIGYPGEDPGSMLATLEEARHIAATFPLARASVWPYYPLPGTELYAEALAAGFRPPATLEDWGRFEEYQLREPWPGQIPRRIRQRRKLYEHFATVSLGLARGREGFWERRARRRLATGDYRLGSLEAKTFDLVNRLTPAPAKKEILSGDQTAVRSGR